MPTQHVSLHLLYSQCAVVDAYLIERAIKELLGIVVGTESERIAAGRYGRWKRCGCHKQAIDVVPYLRTIEDHREMAPLVECERTPHGSRERPSGRADVKRGYRSS